MAETVEEFETWENSTAGRVMLNRLDPRGNKRPELIGPYKKFHITPSERRMNQDRATSPGKDVFKNGVLQPVTPIVTVGNERPDELAPNPNHISRDELTELFKTPKEFRDRVRSITNASALEYMLEVAESQDATVKQVQLLNDRLAELNPTAVTAGTAPGLDQEDPSKLKPVTPR